MKKSNIIFLMLLFLSISVNAQVAINNDNSDPDASAILDVKSTEQGFLLPRMTTVQRDAISSPATGLHIYNTTTHYLEFYDGSAWNQIGAPSAPVIPSVTNPTTGDTWMDRNLGASQIATSSDDAAAYGDLYQWGRLTDGHELRSSGTTTAISTTDDPGHGNFILNSTSPRDWRNPQNGSLWQGVSGINNPCPAGYRLATWGEWSDENASWSSNNAAGAFASPLKLTMGGIRYATDGSLNSVGSSGYYFTSQTWSVYLVTYNFSGSSGGISQSSTRATGMSVRCIKD